MNTVLRFAQVPKDRVEEIKKDIDDYLYPAEEKWSSRERSTYSIGLSDLNDHVNHFEEVVSELKNLKPLIDKWRDSVESIFVDIGLFAKEPSTAPDAPMRCCDFPINQELIKFCYENRIWINVTIYEFISKNMIEH